jgi:hypothetical protein
MRFQMTFDTEEPMKVDDLVAAFFTVFPANHMRLDTIQGSAFWTAENFLEARAKYLAAQVAQKPADAQEQSETAPVPAPVLKRPRGGGGGANRA